MTAHFSQERPAWPQNELTRVPYWVYDDEDVYRKEQDGIYQGPVWNYLGLEAELPEQGDYKTTFVGDMPVIVVRGEDGTINEEGSRWLGWTLIW